MDGANPTGGDGLGLRGELVAEVRGREHGAAVVDCDRVAQPAFDFSLLRGEGPL